MGSERFTSKRPGARNNFLKEGIYRRHVFGYFRAECYEPYDGAACARRPRDSDGAALKVEVTLLGF